MDFNFNVFFDSFGYARVLLSIAWGSVLFFGNKASLVPMTWDSSYRKS